VGGQIQAIQIIYGKPKVQIEDVEEAAEEGEDYE
jgi:hypothetical protein